MTARAVIVSTTLPSVTLDTYAHVFDERDPSSRRDAAGAIDAARREFDVRAEYADVLCGEAGEGAEARSGTEALLRTRTADRLLTMRSETVAVGCHRLRIGLFERVEC